MKKWTSLSHSAGPDSAHEPDTAGLGHNDFSLAGPANGVTCAHTSGGDHARSGRGDAARWQRPRRQGLTDND
jgi:hypothetical protein